MCAKHESANCSVQEWRHHLHVWCIILTMVSLTYILSIQYKTMSEYMIYVGHIGHIGHTGHTGHFRLDIIICYQQQIHKLLL
jgi:hypothetical protein